MPLTLTGTEVYVATMITFLSTYYSTLVETLNHMKSFKLKDHQRYNVEDFCHAKLVDSERLESDGAFKTKNPGHFISIFEDTSDSRFRLWATQEYQEVMEFIKTLIVGDECIMQTDDIISYG